LDPAAWWAVIFADYLFVDILPLGSVVLFLQKPPDAKEAEGGEDEEGAPSADFSRGIHSLQYAGR
jgi:hypothetical protein